ncbi:MAG: hypothetical protein ACOY45_08350 [Pseudomonadota bacterium]
MNAPSVAHVANPSFVEFEAVLDHAGQSNATLRRAFVQRFFDFMLGQRMNVNAEGLVHDVLESVVASFAATYEANVAAPDDTSPPYYYGGVADWLNAAMFEEDTADIINNEVTKRIVELGRKYPDVMNDELFIETENVTPIMLLNKWLDHIELLSELGEGRPYVRVRRVLTILGRCHELLLAHAVTNEGR